MSFSALPAARPRTVGDRCPGAIRLHPAADGHLARLRLPGGLLTADQAAGLARICATHGDGQMHLTIRGNAEIRCVNDGLALAEELTELGLLPSRTHERARNILCSPLAGLGADSPVERAELDRLVRELDAALCASPELAELSGRFAFGIDDGGGDVLAQRPDVAALLAPDGASRLCLDGQVTSRALPSWRIGSVATNRADGTAATTAEADGTGGVPDPAGPSSVPSLAAALVEVTEHFLAAAATRATGAWRIRDLGPQVREVWPDLPMTSPPHGRVPDHPVGVLTGDDGRSLPGGEGTQVVGVVLPLGTADAASWAALAEVARRGDGLLRTTWWRGVVLAGLSPTDARAAVAELRIRGLVGDAGDPRRRLSACTGLPGCARALGDVRAWATRGADPELPARPGSREDRNGWDDQDGQDDRRALRAAADPARASSGPVPGPGHPGERGVGADDLRAASASVDPDLAAGRTVYWAGCARRCGHPGGPHIEYVATGPNRDQVVVGRVS